MSLSKLCPTPNGSSPNPLSERQHPLLLPTVLDTVFPYLPFSDLKSSRLVCKSWSEVGIPFIGRRKHKPVNFSDITHEDFIALKLEFIKYPNKVKLFQGFKLKWDEIPIMVWNNFLASFKPNQLIISGGNVSDPSSNFGKLLQPALTNLTDLSLELDWDSNRFCPPFTALLNNMAQLQSMTLKRLHIKISVYRTKHVDISNQMIHALNRAFEGVFQGQSPFLEELELIFCCVVPKPWKDNGFEFDKIQLPVFPRLQRISLALEMVQNEITTDPENELQNVYLPIFVPFNFCDIFPRLIQLELLDSLMFTMRNDTIILTKGHPLKKLMILHHDGLFSHQLYLDFNHNGSFYRKLYSSFPYIEEFISKDSPLISLDEGGMGFNIPWVDTLRNLDGDGVYQNFNFKHLKKLEFLKFTLDEDFEESEFSIPSVIDILLEHYHQLPHLKRFHISYVYEISPETINQIQEGLPEELRTILTLDQWNIPQDY